MVRYSLLTILGVALIMGLGLMPAFSQRGDRGKDVDFRKIHEEYQKLHTPGEQHKMLQGWIGEYAIEGKMWMDPNRDPATVRGVSKIERINDAFVREKLLLVLPDNKKMCGEGTFGYDNETKTFQTTWIGDWSTTQRVMNGAWDPGAKTMEFKISYQCPVMKVKVNERVVSKQQADGKMILTMYMKPEGSDELKTAEFTYTRLEE